jgi:hypothetical protein
MGTKIKRLNCVDCKKMVETSRANICEKCYMRRWRNHTLYGIKKPKKESQEYKWTREKRNGDPMQYRYTKYTGLRTPVLIVKFMSLKRR